MGFFENAKNGGNVPDEAGFIGLLYVKGYKSLSPETRLRKKEKQGKVVSLRVFESICDKRKIHSTGKYVIYKLRFGCETAFEPNGLISLAL